MKNLSKLTWMLSLVVAGFFMISCDEGEEPIIDDGGGSVSLPPAGIYLAMADSVPSATAALVPSTVEADGFGAQPRNGFYQGYLYLTAGNYNVVEVANDSVARTMGGTVEALTTEGACDDNEVSLVPLAVDGAAFSVPSDGLYFVTFDEQRFETMFFDIVSVGIIGSATPNGWGSDTELANATVTPEGATFEATEIVLREGEWKIRLNCRWNVDRRIDPAGNNVPENGYMAFTNFGGSVNQLLPGNEGANIALEAGNEGTYTVTVTWNARDGWEAAVERTGDAPEITFDPAEYNFGIIGDATAKGWDADMNMVYKEINGVPTWHSVVTLLGSGNLKFRTNDAWDFNIGGTLTTTESSLSVGGADIPTPGAGAYYVTVSTADEGDTWTATMSEAGWGIIGEGSPQGNWDADIDLEAVIDNGVEKYTITGNFTTAEFKVRAGDGWDFNLGGSLDALVPDGDNLSVGSAGTYTFEMTYDGESFSATMTQ